MIPLFLTEIKNIDTYIAEFVDHIVAFIPSLITAIAIFIGGIIAIKILRKAITRILSTRDIDSTFLKFILDVCTWIIRAMLFIAIIQQLGVETSSFVAALGAAGLAVGLSLQGSLSNFAGGLLIVLFKPFRVGDTIEAQGQSGTVLSIQIFSTQLLTGNNQVVYLPNGTLSNNTIKNFSQEPLRRAEIALSVSYSSDLKLVKEVIHSVIDQDQKILKTPAPSIEIKDLAENAIIINVQLWSERAHHGTMVSDFYENVKSAFESSGIHIPFPQRELHIRANEKLN
ncbi:mechanosensitive ion channel family protein [Flavobacterium hauense]